MASIGREDDVSAAGEEVRDAAFVARFEWAACRSAAEPRVD